MMHNFFHIYICLALGTPPKFQKEIRLACISEGVKWDNAYYQELNGVIELGATNAGEAEHSFYRISEELKEKLRPYKEYIVRCEVYLVTHKTSLDFDQ